MKTAAVLVSLIASALAAHVLDVVPGRGASFDLNVDGKTWLTSTDVLVYADSEEFRASNGTLSLSSNTTFTGTDYYGAYSGWTWTWKAGTAEIETTIQTYAAENMALFRTVWVNGARNTSTKDDDSTASSFPSWNLGAIPASSNLGYMAVTGDMCGSSPKFGKLDSSITDFPGGMHGTGPVAVFDPSTAATLVISPAFNFMSASHAMHPPYLQSGVMGGASEIPAGYKVEFIASVAPEDGVNAGFDHWGHLLRDRFQKGHRRDSDVTLEFLQYSTDNGAYYYYHTEDNKDYEQTLKDVWAYAEQEKIPYRGILLDSWWYFKGKADGVKEWLPMPSIFPDGMTAVTNFTGPPIAHNRFWASDNVYAKQNGGDWDFLLDGDTMLPLQQEFWDWLMETSRNWGLRTYEQDWLDYNVDRITELRTNVTLGRMWLRQMNNALEKQGMTQQYCMSMVRHIMQSVELPAVTQARASGDYHSGETDQWNIGSSSILADAIGIYPTKDNAWSTEIQTGNPYGKSRTEPFSRLNFAVLSFSRGPVAPSDGVGFSDASLIMRSCTKMGKLLRPDRPMRKMDGSIMNAALGSAASAINGETWSTFTVVGGRFHAHAIATNVDTAFSLSASDLIPAEVAPAASYVYWEANDTSAKPLAKIPVATCGKKDFQLFHVSPVGPSGWALIGEMNKWVPTSNDRFTDILESGKTMTVIAEGDSGETIDVSFSDATGAITTVSCTMTETGRLAISVPAKTCSQQ